MAIGKVLSSDRDFDVVNMGCFHDLFWQFQLIFALVFFLKFECFQNPPSSITAGCTQSGQVQKMESGEAKSVTVEKMEVHNEVIHLFNHWMADLGCFWPLIVSVTKTSSWNWMGKSGPWASTARKIPFV